LSANARAISSPDTYLLRIATNVAIDQLRRASVRPIGWRVRTAEISREHHGIAADRASYI
jgi:DNA-directed RNA polymerase specialized sigma24 family protein